MTNDNALQVICFAMYVIAGVITYWATRQNGAPKWTALFLGVTYPVVLPICITYEYIVTNQYTGTTWWN